MTTCNKIYHRWENANLKKETTLKPLSYLAVLHRIPLPAGFSLWLSRWVGFNRWKGKQNCMTAVQRRSGMAGVQRAPYLGAKGERLGVPLATPLHRIHSFRLLIYIFLFTHAFALKNWPFANQKALGNQAFNACLSVCFCEREMHGLPPPYVCLTGAVTSNDRGQLDSVDSFPRERSRDVWGSVKTQQSLKSEMWNLCTCVNDCRRKSLTLTLLTSAVIDWLASFWPWDVWWRPNWNTMTIIAEYLEKKQSHGNW